MLLNIISCDKSATLKMNELQQNELISQLISTVVKSAISDLRQFLVNESP